MALRCCFHEADVLRCPRNAERAREDQPPHPGPLSPPLADPSRRHTAPGSTQPLATIAHQRCLHTRTHAGFAHQHGLERLLTKIGASRSTNRVARVAPQQRQTTVGRITALLNALLQLSRRMWCIRALVCIAWCRPLLLPFQTLDPVHQRVGIRFLILCRYVVKCSR